MTQDENRPKTLRHRLSNWFDNLSPSQAAKWFFGVGIGVVVVGFLVRQRIIRIEFLNIETIIDELYSNFGIELISIGLTVLVIDSLNRRQAEKERVAIEEANRQRAEQEHKQDLIAQMTSPSNDFALEAVRLLRLKGGLTDGSLQAANLSGANLQGAVLWGAQLQKTLLFGTNLQGVNLLGANLQGAFLLGSKLQGANLTGVNLKGAYLRRPNLQETLLIEPEREEENSFYWTLQMMLFEVAILDENTILPDGTKWTLGRDMREFTHPDEWKVKQAAKIDGNAEDTP